MSTIPHRATPPRRRTPTTNCSPSPKSPTSSGSPSPPCATGATSAPARRASGSGRSVRYWRSEVLHWLEKQSSHPRATR